MALRSVDRERDRVREAAREALAVRVVDVDHRGAGLGLDEQPPLGREVVLHRRVEVQVVLGQVREDRDGEVDRVRAPQFQGMGGDLHHARPIATIDHLAKRALQVDRLRSRANHFVLLPADHRRDGPEQPGPAVVGLEQCAGDERGCGLAVGARDADGLELRGRVAVEASRGRSHRRADAVHVDLRNAEVQRALDDERGRAASDRLGGEVVAVAREPGDAEEQRPGRDRPVVVGEAGDLEFGCVGRSAGKHALAEHRLGGYLRRRRRPAHVDVALPAPVGPPAVSWRTPASRSAGARIRRGPDGPSARSRELRS